MALRARTLLSVRLWAAGFSTSLCSSPSPRAITFLSRTPSASASAATVASPSSNAATTTTTSSSSSSSSSKVDVQVLQASKKRVLQGEAADRIARAAAVMDDRALRGGFVPFQTDVHLETASQFGGPGASAMSNMVEAVYGMFAGDSKSVEKSVGQLTHGTAGVPHRPLNTRWARAHASVSSTQEEEEEATAIRETLAAYRFAGMGPRAVTAGPEAAAQEPAEATSAEAPAEAAAAGPVAAIGFQAETGV